MLNALYETSTVQSTSIVRNDGGSVLDVAFVGLDGVGVRDAGVAKESREVVSAVRFCTPFPEA